MFDKNDVILLKNCCQRIIESPRSMDQQMHVVSGGCVWCDDWRIIEILKCLFLGRSVYLADPPPNRLKNNPLWSQSAIVDECDRLSAQYKSAAAVVEHLEKERGVSKNESSA